MSEDRPERGFVVVDKRGRDEREETAPESTGETERASHASEEMRELPRPDFTSLVISLGTSALYHLGLMRDPQTGETGTRDLALASQAIDTVEMLRDKTRGNLEKDEEELLQSMLTDLRMRYVEVSRSSKGGG